MQPPGHPSTRRSTPARLQSACAAQRVARLRPLTDRVGLLAVGHHTYWQQFAGLLDEMHRKI